MEDKIEVFNELIQEYHKVREKVVNGILSVDTVVKLHRQYKKHLRIRLPESIIYEGEGDRFYYDEEGNEIDKDNRDEDDKKIKEIDDEEVDEEVDEEIDEEVDAKDNKKVDEKDVEEDDKKVEEKDDKKVEEKDDKKVDEEDVEEDDEEDVEEDYVEEYIKLTILHMSLYLDDPEFFDYLVDNNADLHKSTKHFGPILHCCIMKGAHYHFQKLVDANVDENLRAYIPQISCSCTPTELAVLCADSKAIEFLIIEAGCSAFLDDSYGCTTLLNIAAYYGHSNIIIFLLKLMCNVNLVSRTRYRSMSPLLAAVGSPHADAEAVKNLLYYPGININIVNDEGRSALHEFFFHRNNGNLQVLHYLLIAGINVNVVDNDGLLPMNEWGWYRNQNYFSAWIVFIKHLVKLRAAGIYVCDEYSEAMDNMCCDIVRVNYMVDVLRMIQTLIPGTQSSYYELLLLNFDPKLESTLPHSNIDFDAITKYDLRKTFPYYAESLIYRLSLIAIAQKKMEAFEAFPEDKPPIFTT